MSLDVLKSRIKENNLSGVFMFCGPEEYTKDHYADKVRKKVDSSPLPEFNHVYFNAANGNIGELEDSIYSLPYMWDSKLIEIIDVESARFNDAEIEDYARVFSDIPDYLTILIVLRADERTEEKRTAKNDNGLKNFITTVNEFGLVVEFNNEKSDKLVTWITRHFNAKGVTFETNVPREIINVCGNDMYILQGEILKLSEAYTGKPLKAADVYKYCCANDAFKYFDLVNALNRRDLIATKRIYESLDIGYEDITMAIGMLAKNYSEMIMVKSALESGKGYDAVAKDLKKQSWQIGKIAQSVENLDTKGLLYAVSQLHIADTRIKSLRGNAKKVLEMALYRICTYGRKA